jgi:hypothetical protein
MKSSILIINNNCTLYAKSHRVNFYLYYIWKIGVFSRLLTQRREKIQQTLLQ